MIARVLLVLGVLSGTASASPARFGEPTALQLGAGLRAVLQASTESPTVSIVARVARGYHDDPEHAPGTAHLVEHLWYRAVVDGVDVWTALQQRGCDTSATTGPSETTYVATCPAGESAVLVRLFADGLAEPTRGVDAATVAVEVAVIDQERRERAQGGRALFQALYQNLLPEDDPAHVAFVEPDWSLPALTLAGARSWTKDNYTPDNQVLAITGGFDPAVATQILEERFGASGPVTTEPRAAGRAQAPAPARSTEVVRLTRDDPTSVLALGWNLPARLGNSVGFSIAAGHLGSALDSALQDEPDVLSAGCSVQRHPTAPALVCTLSVDAAISDPSALQATVDEALRDAWSRADRKQLRRRLLRVRAEAPQDLLLGHTEPRARAHRFVSLVAGGRPVTPIEQSIDEVRRWKPTGSVALASRWFTPERAARVFVSSGREAVAEVGPDAALPAAVPAPSGAVLDGELPAQPPVRVARRQLPSGLVVLGVHRPESPYVMATIHLPGGHGAGPAGLTALAETLSTGPRRSEAWGVRANHAVHRDRIELWTVAPSAQLFRAIDALRAEVSLRIPLVDADEERDEDLDRYVRRRKSALQAKKREKSWLAERALAQAITPEHAASRGLTEADLDAMRSIDGSTLAAYLWRTYQPSQATVIVTGPQDADAIVALAARRFRRFRVRQGIPPEPYPTGPPAAEPSSLRAVLDDPALGYAAIRLRCRLPDPGTWAERRVLSRMIDDALWSSLRHQRGLTYTPASYISYWPDGTAQLDVAVDTLPQRAGVALAETTSALRRLARSPQVATAIDRELRHQAARSDSLEGVEAQVYRASRAGVDGDPLAWHRDQLEGVSAADLGADLASCLERRAWVVQGPARAVSPALDAEGLTHQTLGVE